MDTIFTDQGMNTRFLNKLVVLGMLSAKVIVLVVVLQVVMFDYLLVNRYQISHKDYFTAKQMNRTEEIRYVSYSLYGNNTLYTEGS